MIRTALLGTAALVAIVQSATPAVAQEAAAAPESEPGEIVVTAQKRTERLQDVPVAVSVVSGDALNRQGALNIENAQYLVPTLNFRKSGISLNQSLYIRGVGTTTFSIGGEPSVSTVLDGVVLSRAGEAFTDLVDIERIEVLRGPQGTLFGKNASAGAVSITSKRPTQDLGGFVEGGYFFDNGNEYRFRGAINVPLTDKVATRITGFYSDWQGNIFNEAVGRRVNGYTRYGVRGIVEAKPSDRLTLTLIGDWRKSNDDCCAEVIGAPALTAAGTPVTLFTQRAAVALPALQGDRTRRIRQNQITRSLETSWGISGTAELALDDVTLTSITAYRRYDAQEIRDGDFLDRPYVGGGGFQQSHDNGPQTSGTFTQELRLTSASGGPLEWTAGAFFYYADQQRSFTRANINCNGTTPPEVAPGLRPCNLAANPFTAPFGTATFGTTFTNAAIFGQASYALTDRFKLIGGLRYTLDHVSGYHSRVSVGTPAASNPNFDEGVFNSVSAAFPNGNPAASNGIPFRQQASATNISGKAGVQYEFSDAINAYVTYARGYKGPGLNIFFNLNANGTPPLASENADSVEGGVKTSLFDGRLTINLAGYWARYYNFQANNPDFILNQRVTRFTNAGTISTRGFEAEFAARPVKDLNIGGGVAYTDAHVDAFRLPAGANPADFVPQGVQLPFAPQWKATLNGDYTFRTGGPVDINVGVQSSYQSSQLSLLVGNPVAREQSRIRAYSLVDLQLSLVDPEDRFRVTFLVKNVANESFAAAISDGGPLTTGAENGPGGTTSYRYLIPREANRYFGIVGRVNF